MKKILALLLVATILCFSLVGLTSCAGKYEFTEFVLPEGGYDGSEVTITFTHTMGEKLQTVLNYHIGEFNKLYPNIKVEHTSGGGYDDVRSKISKQITVGNQPNIAYCYPDHVALYNVAGAVVDLNVLINSEIPTTDALGNEGVLGLTEDQISNFIEGYYNEGMMFGDLNGDGVNEMYTMPYYKSTEVLYYNKTFFAENNLSVPTTWEEMKETCKKIKEIDATCIPLGYDSEANWFITMCEQYGSPYTSASGEHYLFNNDQNKAFVKEFMSWYDLGYVTTEEIYGSYTSGLFTATEGTRSYMCIGSSAGASYQCPAADDQGNYPFEVGIATPPQVNPQNPKVISQGPSVCIFKDEDPQKVVASWLLVKYLTTSIDYQAEVSMESGYVPVIKNATDNVYYQNYLNKSDRGNSHLTALSVKVGLEQADAYYTSPAFNGSSTAREQVGLLMQKCFLASGQSDLDAYINKMFEEAVQKCEYASKSDK